LVLSLSAEAYLPTCDGGKSLVPLTYSWSVFTGNNKDISLVSISKDPSKFTLPSYSLKPNLLYKIVVQVYGDEATSEASVQVLVDVGKVIAIIKGSSQKKVRLSETMTLDATMSFDEDNPDVYGKEAGLKFIWSCIQLQPFLNQSCGMVFDQQQLLRQRHDSILTLRPLDSAEDSTAEITLTVYDTMMTRSAVQTVFVTIVPLLSPVLNLVSNSNNGVINTGQVLQLSASIGMPSTLSANVSWSLSTTSDSLDLSSVTLSPLTTRFEAKRNEDSQSDNGFLMSYMLYLGLKPNSLISGLSYTFVVDCQVSMPGISSSSSITISVNVAPLPGTFEVIPTEGYELIDSFTFASSQWQDSDLPLTYQYSYITTSGLMMMIRSRSESSYGTTILPAGSMLSGFQVQCVGEIFDNLMGNRTVFLPIVVRRQEETSENSAFREELLRASLYDSLATPSVDSIKQSSAIASYLLNQVDCSAAPNCTDRNRQACFRTRNTCGPCISSTYIGTEGDSNDACLPIVDVYSMSVPDLSVKACVNDCSGHGECRYYSSLQMDQEVLDCSKEDFTCNAICLCEDGYAQSSDCSLSDDEIIRKQILRQQMISNIGCLTSIEDASEQAVSSWISNLAQATQNSYELSNQATDLALDIVDDIVQQSLGSELGYTSVSSVLNVLDNVVTSVATTEMRRRRMRRRLLESTDDSLHSNSTSASVRVIKIAAVLKNYTTYVAAQMLPGQYPIEAVASNFRVVVVNVDSNVNEPYSGNCTNSIDLETPLTILEKRIGAESSKIRLPTCSSVNTDSDGNVISHKISIVSTSLQIYPDADLLLGDPLSLHMSNFPCDKSLDQCEVRLVLPRIVANVNFQGIEVGGVVPDGSDKEIKIYCEEEDFTMHSIECPNARNYTVHCNGTAETIVTRCPLKSVEPTCDFLSMTQTMDASANNCKMISYTHSNVTCVCSLVADQYKYASSQLRSGDGNTSIPQGEFSVSYVSMLTTVSDTFVSTITTASELNVRSIERGWQALVTIGTLFCAFLIFVCVAHFADMSVTKKVMIEGNNDRQAALQLKKRSKTFSSILKRLRAIGTATDGRAKALKKLVTHHNNEINAIIQLTDKALPQVLMSSKSLTNKVKDEIKRHHRWFAIVFHFSRSFPRVLRVVSLATNIVCMLFIQSLTYNLTNGDDGSCERYDNEVDCLQPSSAYATSAAKCYWTQENLSVGQCRFVQPDQDLTVIIFVAIFSAVVSTPIALFSDWIIQHVLSAPKLTIASSTDVIDKSSLQIISGSNGMRNRKSDVDAYASIFDKLESNIPIVTGPRQENKKIENRRHAFWMSMSDNKKDVKTKDHTYWKLVDKDLHALIQELKGYRQTLMNDPRDLAEFDSKYDFVNVYRFLILP
jgi:hypothetical protein